MAAAGMAAAGTAAAAEHEEHRHTVGPCLSPGARLMLMIVRGLPGAVDDGRAPCAIGL